LTTWWRGKDGNVDITLGKVCTEMEPQKQLIGSRNSAYLEAMLGLWQMERESPLYIINYLNILLWFI
jgi:hypothetical protein